MGTKFLAILEVRVHDQGSGRVQFPGEVPLPGLKTVDFSLSLLVAEKEQAL